MSSAESPARTRSGQVLTALYGEHAPEAFRYALHLTGRRADAEDVVQQVFLQAYRHLESGRELVSPRAWLLTAVRHRAFNLARDRRDVPVDDPQRSAAPADSGRDEAAQLADVRGMLWTLPEAQHHAFVLRHWSGLSQNEIAQVLETTPTAVESLLVRARSGVLRAHSSASDACNQIRRRLLDSTELGTSDEAHLGTCRPCRQAHTRLVRAANIAGTLALVPGTHVADSIAGLVPGFSAHAATSAMAGVGTAGGAGVGAGGSAGGASVWGTTTAVTTVSKVAVVAKATAAVVAATVAIGTIPPAHHAMSALIARHVRGSSSGSAPQASGAKHHGRSGQHGPPAQDGPALPGNGALDSGRSHPKPTHPGKRPQAGKGPGKRAGGTGHGNAGGNGKGLGKPAGNTGKGNAGGNGNGVGKPAGGTGKGNAGGNGNGVGKPAGGTGNGNAGGNGNGGGKPAGAGGGNDNAGGNGSGNGKGGGKPA